MMAQRRGSRRLKVERVVPSAWRTVASLRDVGYDTSHAIADIVDNSIAAGATRVDIVLKFEGADSWISIADNGEGMDSRTIVEAMRYGTEREYEKNDLGKFGFGLKTASTSQCRRMVVASRRATQRARMEVRCLDLDHIEATNAWEILVLEREDRPDHATRPLLDHRGTVVLWQQLDRVLHYREPGSEWARRRLLTVAKEVQTHLAMVFHRFLSGDAPSRRLRIRVNGRRVEPWDPFCQEEEGTEALPAKDLTIASSDGLGFVRVRPYVLPRQVDFSGDSAWRSASGPSNWNRQQGFYIYRSHRMIQSGGWSRMRTADEHTKLARIALDFFPDLDSAFGINIAKASVTLPAELREQLEPIVTEATRKANQRYRAGGRGTSKGVGSKDSRKSATRVRVKDHGAAHGRLQEKEIKGRRRAIEEAAETVGERRALRRIVGVLKVRDPDVAHDLGW
jgi:hypothetical protein